MNLTMLFVIVMSLVGATWASCSIGDMCLPGISQNKKIRCADCTCTDSGRYRCCFSVPKPYGYNSRKCDLRFDEATCSYKLVRRGKSRKTCTFDGYLG